ncbi:EAL domain-containing protein [Vandammella animalimorsus]|uniref:EAL domain-containing protein n=1 Tax=Vandammella animalimorsus TaxID=2029117 RepID=A0A3M6RLD5_9BURK|nr:EAL domain-containing protein [Vandammella animalimorsus]RMX15342.1 EAL domain-containing protein [Vandammella animalimorsus]
MSPPVSPLSPTPPPMHSLGLLRVLYRLVGLVATAAVLTTLLWLHQRSSLMQQQAVQAQAQAQALRHAYALQTSAQGYARMLHATQVGLRGNAAQDAQLLQTQWDAAQHAPGLINASTLRLLPAPPADLSAMPPEDAALWATVRQPTSPVPQALARSEGLTLFTQVPLHTATGPQQQLLTLDLRYDSWLREVQRSLGLEPSLPQRLYLEPAPAQPEGGSPQPSTRPEQYWHDGQLHTRLAILGQELELVLAAPPPSAQAEADPLAPPESGASSAEHSSPGQYMLWLPVLVATLTLLLYVLLRAWHMQRVRQQLRHWRQYASDSNEHYLALINHPLLAVAQVEGAAGQFISTSPRLAQLLGYSQDSLQRLTLASLAHPEDVQRLHRPETLEPQRANARYRYGRIGNLRLLHSLGHVVWVDLLEISPREPHGASAPSSSPQERRLLIVHDQSQTRTLQAQLNRRIQRQAAILEQVPLGLCILDNQMRIQFMNQGFQRISQLKAPLPESLEEWWQCAIADAGQRQSARARWDAQLARAIAGNGVVRPVEISLQPAWAAPQDINAAGLSVTLELSALVLDDQMVLTLVDVSAHKRAQHALQLQALYDRISSLPNRFLLLDRLQQALQRTARAQYGALLLLEVAPLSEAHNLQEHDWAAPLVREVASRLKACCPLGQTLAHTGPGQFALLIHASSHDGEEAMRQSKDLGYTILHAMQAPFRHGGQHMALKAFLGIALFHGQRTESANALWRQAHQALEQAQRQQLKEPCFFDPGMQAASNANAQLEESIRSGIAMQQFVLYLQPQVRHHQLTGAEVLLRWRGGQGREVIAPDQFLAAAEHSNLIVPLGHWVLAQSCRLLAAWAQHPQTEQLSLSINISAKQFWQDNFAAMVLQTIASTCAPAHRLVLELTEEVLQQDLAQSIACMRQLRAYGVGFALDGFGRGESSLKLLQQLPLDEVGIDYRIVRDLGSATQNARTVHSIVQLCHNLGIRAMAKGVEEAAQVEILKSYECYHWQGYFIGKPLPVADFERQFAHAAPPA